MVMVNKEATISIETLRNLINTARKYKQIQSKALEQEYLENYSAYELCQKVNKELDELISDAQIILLDTLNGKGNW